MNDIAERIAAPLLLVLRGVLPTWRASPAFSVLTERGYQVGRVQLEIWPHPETGAEVHLGCLWLKPLVVHSPAECAIPYHLPDVADYIEAAHLAFRRAAHAESAKRRGER
jgi:hypothetical protein